MIGRPDVRDGFKFLLTAIPFAAWPTLRRLKKKYIRAINKTRSRLSECRERLVEHKLFKEHSESVHARIDLLTQHLDTLLNQGSPCLAATEPNRGPSPEEVFWYIQRLRRTLPFSSIELLARDLVPGYLHSATLPDCPKVYGHYHAIKTFAGLPASYAIKACVDHSAYWDAEGPLVEHGSSYPVICMAPERADHLIKHHNRIAYPIGPFITYAEDLLTEREFSREKSRLGRSLLVFPAHSNIVVTNTYDVTRFIAYIRTMGDAFDSIRICLYHEDIIGPKNRVILRALAQPPFELITAGSRFDLDYLPRLKSMIKLSDYVLTNRMGAYIGYAVALGKPVVYFHQDMTSSINNSILCNNEAIIRTVEKETLLHDEIAEQLKTHFAEICSAPTDSQLQFVEKYWGLSQIKTRDEVRQMIEDLERIYNNVPLSIC